MLAFLRGASNTEPLITVYRTPSTTNVQLILSIPTYAQDFSPVSYTLVRSETQRSLLPDIRADGTGTSEVAIIDGDGEFTVAGYTGGSCSTFLAIPMEALGLSYFVITYAPSSATQQAMVSIAAGPIATTVLIVIPNGMTFNYEGQTYTASESFTRSIQSYTALVIEYNSDLTGLYVQANQEVAIFAGNNIANIGPGGADSVGAQLPSVDRWGQRFVVVPGSNDDGYIKVVAEEANTQVLFYSASGTAIVDMNLVNTGSNGIRHVNDATYIYSDKPILVMFYTNSDNGYLPSAMVITPAEQYHNYYLFNTFNAKTETFPIFQVALTVVVNDIHKGGIILNGMLQVATGWTAIPSTPYVVKRIEGAPSGDFEIYHADSQVDFGLFVYGTNGADCTFSMPAGSRYNIINPVSS